MHNSDPAKPKLYLIVAPGANASTVPIPDRYSLFEKHEIADLAELPPCSAEDRVVFLGDALFNEAVQSLVRRSESDHIGIDWLVDFQPEAPVASRERVQRSIGLLATDLNVGESRPEGWRILDSQSPDSEIRNALSTERYELLLMHCHGSGFDIKLGHRLAGCNYRSIERAHRDRQTLRAPACVSTGECFRLNAPIEALPTHPDFLDLSEIEARILILDSCYAFGGPNSSIQPQLHALLALLHSGRVDCIVAHAGLPETNWNQYFALYECLAEGMPIAHAVGKALNTDPDQPMPSVVFGDPTTRLERPHKSVCSPYPRASRRSVIKDLHRLAGLRSLVLSLATERPRQIIGEAINALSIHEAALVRQPADSLASLNRLHKSMCAIIDPQNAHLFWHWKRAGHLEDSQRETFESDGSSVQLDRIVTMSAPGEEIRHIVFCPQRGPLYDAPAHWQASACGSAEGLEVKFERDRTQAWFGMIAIAGDRPGECIATRWPADTSGEPSRFLEAADIPIIGRRRMAGILFSGLEFAIFSSFLPATEDKSV